MKKKHIAGEILPLSKYFNAENSQGQGKRSSTEKTSKGLLQRKKNKFPRSYILLNCHQSVENYSVW